jgi:hypothetical protein
MPIETVDDKVPPGRLGGGGHRAGPVRHKVLFQAWRAHGRRPACALHPVDIGDQRHRAMSDSFVLASLLWPKAMSLAGWWRSRAWMPGHCVRRDDALARVPYGWRLRVERGQVGHLGRGGRIRLSMKPIAAFVRSA